MPLIVQSTKQTTTSFNLSIIKSHMHIATKSKATLVDTKAAIVNMYQNGTTANLSPQAQKAAHALAQYIYANKKRKKFAFVLGKDHQDQQLLLLTIANHPIKSQTNASLQKSIRQVPIDAQKQQNLSLVKQLSWVTNALHKAEFGILFWIYQHRLSGQEALLGTKQVPLSITTVNFQRVKTPHEQLQDEAWAKTMQVIQNITSHQLKIRANDQELPSQTKITASYIALAIQKIITSNDAISKVAQKLINADHIEVQWVDETGTIIITIKNYGNVKMIIIFGFKATGTPLAIAQAKIDHAQAEATPPTKLSQVLHGQAPRAADVNAPIKAGVAFTFQAATTVNDNGESDVTYIVDVVPTIRGTIPKELTFIVGGFETKVEVLNKANARIQAVTTETAMAPTKKNKVRYGAKPTSSDINPPSQIGFSFSFKEASAINDLGEAEVTYTIDVVPAIKGTIPKELTFTVGGFETKVDADVRDNIDRANARIQALVASWGRGITLPTKKRAVREKQVPRASDLNPPIKEGFSFTFKRATLVSEYKDSNVTYTVDVVPAIKGTTPRYITFLVRGFS